MLRLLAAIALLLVTSGARAFECPPPGYDGNADCGYQCGEGFCCGNPWYRGSVEWGTWKPDPSCVVPRAVGHPAKSQHRSLRRGGRAPALQATRRAVTRSRRRTRVSLTKPFVLGSFFKLTHYRPLTHGTEREQCSSYVLDQEVDMLKTFVEEAAALASITLFVGTIAIWAQLIPQL